MKSAYHISLYLFVFFLGLIFSHNAAALMGTPMQFDISLSPGKDVTKTIQVTHGGERPMTLAVSVKDYYYDKDGKKQESDPGTIPEGLGRFIKASPMTFDLKPGESKPVTFTVKMPPDAPGSHWTTIYISQTSRPKPRKLAQGKSGLELFTFFRVAVRVLQFDPLVKERAGHISDMTIELNSKTAVPAIYVTFENDTKNILRCKGHVQILNENGEMIAKLPLYKSGAFTAYPYRPRVTSTLIKDRLLPGTYIALATIDFGGEDLVAGELEFDIKP